MRATEAVRGRKVPSEVRTLRIDRDLGAGRGRQMGGKRTREMTFTGKQCRNPGSRRDLGIRSRTARKSSTGNSGGGWRVGVTSR